MAEKQGGNTWLNHSQATEVIFDRTTEVSRGQGLNQKRLKELRRTNKSLLRKKKQTKCTIKACPAARTKRTAAFLKFQVPYWFLH